VIKGAEDWDCVFETFSILQRCWRSMSQEKHQFSSGKGYLLPTYSIAQELTDEYRADCAIVSNLSSTMIYDKLAGL
jgi:hypothetical protein